MPNKKNTEQFLQSSAAKEAAAAQVADARSLPAAGQTSAPSRSLGDIYGETSQRNRATKNRKKLSSRQVEAVPEPTQGPAIPVSGAVDPNYGKQQQQPVDPSDPPVADAPTPEQQAKRQEAADKASWWKKIQDFTNEPGQLPFIPGERPLWQNALAVGGAAALVGVPGVMIAQSMGNNQAPIVVPPSNQERSQQQGQRNGS
ncbi:hypothetical protein [Synechococcus elongatus]|uniref:hypothetical protein n=1 Tax=Synechococcus elongatus TaxID=32046 RepID=UPI000F7FA5BB|nr:hypothetical protein [Synechococcus elongatus]